MAFIQVKLTKSFNQSRGIFDKYVYQPGNSDSIATILGSGYFDDSRYLDDPDWLGSIIEISATNGYAIARIVTGGLVVLYNSTTSGSNSAIITTLQTRAALGNTVTGGGSIIQIGLTGTGDALLPPPATAQPVSGGSYNGYEKVTGLVQIAASGELSVSGGSLVIGSNGDGSYRTPHAWVDMSANQTATTVGFIFGIVKVSDGLVHFSQRVTGTRMSAQDDRTNVSGGGFVDGLEPGDTLSMWVAADKTATVTIYDMNIGLEMSIAESLK